MFPDTVPWVMPIGPSCPCAQSLRMAQTPTLKAVSFNNLAQKYRAIDFQDALADFIAQTNHPSASGAMLSALASDTLIPFFSVSVHHQIKFTTSDGSEIINSILAWPYQKDICGQPVPSRFDTALIQGKNPHQEGLVHSVDGKFSKYIPIVPT
jgi:hypothetical protein